ncbi:MAG: nucleotidyltransferase family protein [Lachnospiraceae bacterium]|jgi:predicted nucleotidyltransferase|nr:nucleotidyltransferase family protein [Lachnospiraceae bacterium]
MKTAGIIAEYNPFHNGHAYHIRETRRLTGASHIVVIMSGDFVQRGEPAILNKYVRARMALMNGADLVLELPVACATASAESFAAGAVGILDRLGIVEVVSFGCEHRMSPLFDRLARLYLKEPRDYALLLKEGLRQGLTYPKARARATGQWLKEHQPDALPPENLLSSPNSILALEYHKALIASGSRMKPVTVLRKGDYHSTELPGERHGEASLSEYAPAQTSGSCFHSGSSSASGSDYASASAIRALLFSKDIRGDSLAPLLSRQVPPDVATLLLSRSDYMQADDFSLALGYALLSACLGRTEENGLSRVDGLSCFADLSPELARRIAGHVEEYAGFTAFTDRIKTRQLTRTRVSRALLHLLLQIREDQTDRWRQRNFAFYARVLGFRKSGVPLLSAIKKKGSLPILTKMADARETLRHYYKEENPAILAAALEMLQADLFAAGLYETTAAARHSRLPENEFRHGLVFPDGSVRNR